jgi:Icc-related predicted phosphoesterase
MRMLLVSDLHYTLKQLDWVLAEADAYDVVVVAGDHLDIGSYVEPDAQIAVVLEYLARIAAKTTVVACSGNHDLDAENDFGERAAMWLERASAARVHVDGSHVIHDDLVITVCPWWDGPLTRDAVDAQLAQAAVDVGARRWIWVYHAPPDASPTSWTGRRHYGDDDLNAWVETYQPTLVLCGHVHESPFANGGRWIDRIGDTVVVNAGRERGSTPAHIVVDTERGELRWRSSAGVESAPFAAQYSG